MKNVKTNMWTYQHLLDKGLHHVTEKDENGEVINTYTFSTYAELEYFVTKYRVPIFLPHLIEHHPILNIEEFYLSSNNILTLDFECHANIFSGNHNSDLFRSHYKITLELIKYSTEKELGIMLKRMLYDLEKYINKINKENE